MIIAKHYQASLAIVCDDCAVHMLISAHGKTIFKHFIIETFLLSFIRVMEITLMFIKLS